jgi:hypothetical protein
MSFIGVFESDGDPSRTSIRDKIDRLKWLTSLKRWILSGISSGGSPFCGCPELNADLRSVGHRGRSGAKSADGTILCKIRQPFLDTARPLISAGIYLGIMIMGWRTGSTSRALRALFGDAATLTVQKTKPHFPRWNPFPSPAAATSTRVLGSVAMPDVFRVAGTRGGTSRERKLSAPTG